MHNVIAFPSFPALAVLPAHSVQAACAGRLASFVGERHGADGPVDGALLIGGKRGAEGGGGNVQRGGVPGEELGLPRLNDWMTDDH